MREKAIRTTPRRQPDRSPLYQKLLDTTKEAAVVDGVRRGLEDANAGRPRPLAEAFDDIRRELGLAQG